MTERAFVIVGPMSAGNRMLRSVLEAGGLSVRIDRSHGTMDWDGDETPVVITRSYLATERSREAGWKGHPEEIKLADSIVGIRARYPRAFTFRYESLCEDVDREIGRFAEAFGLQPWSYDGELINQNQKWLTGEGGPQLGEGAPNNPSISRSQNERRSQYAEL